MSDKIEQVKNPERKSYRKSMITKEQYDGIWNKLFYFCLVLTAIGIFFMIRGVSKFRNALITFNPTYDFSKYSDFLICIPIIIIFSLFKYYTQKCLVKLCEKILKKSYRFPTNDKDRQLWERYRLKLPEHAFKGIMYTILTASGYCILKDLNYYPKSLLGNGWLPNMFIKGYPNSFYLEKPPLFDFYYMFCLSYFSCDLIWLLFISAHQTDFINMLLHHICTISLIIFSYLVNYSNVGSIVLILHFITDIFVHLTRFLIQTDAPEIFKNASGLALVFSFLYIRIYVLGDIIYVLYHYITWKGVIDWFLIIFLSIIYLMHINWAILLVQKMFALFMGTSIYDTREYKVKESESKQKVSKKI